MPRLAVLSGKAGSLAEAATLRSALSDDPVFPIPFADRKSTMKKTRATGQ
jgi:hypothetical protein